MHEQLVFDHHHQ